MHGDGSVNIPQGGPQGLVSLCSPLVENSPNGWVWFWGIVFFIPDPLCVNYEVSHHKYGHRISS